MVETNASPPNTLPQDIRKALQRHDSVLRLSGSEIVSGIKRLLRQGIPKEVVSRVITLAAEAVAKDFDPLTSQDIYPRIETQLDAFTAEEASLREPPHPTRPAGLAAFPVEESAFTAETSSLANIPKCEEISASGTSLNGSIFLHDTIPVFRGQRRKKTEESSVKVRSHPHLTPWLNSSRE